MKYSTLPRLLFFIPAIIYSGFVFAQDCVVEKESLKGSYSGDCRNGKANGKGKAVGTDSYEGEFKSGQPEGDGTYTWDNGNRYTGKFVKGLRDGKGTMFYKRTNAPDSIVEGFWKKDAYVGKYEKPYVVYFRSKSVTEVQVESKKNSFKQITFFVTNTSGGGTSVDGGEIPKMKVDDIELTRGSYGRTLANSDHVKKTEMILYDVVFPIRMKVTIGSEQVEIEFNEEASYNVNVRINQ
jgi:hypothetical protein